MRSRSYFQYLISRTEIQIKEIKGSIFYLRSCVKESYGEARDTQDARLDFQVKLLELNQAVLSALKTELINHGN